MKAAITGSPCRAEPARRDVDPPRPAVKPGVGLTCGRVQLEHRSEEHHHATAHVLLLPVDGREHGQVDGAPRDGQPHPRGEEREAGKHDADVLDPELPQLVAEQPQLCGHEPIQRLSVTPIRIIVRRGREQRLSCLISAVSQPRLVGVTYGRYFLISPKTSGSWSFILSLSIIFACFYACCLEFFLLSIIIVPQPLDPPALSKVSPRTLETALSEWGGWSTGK